MCGGSLGTVEGFDVPVLAGWGMVSGVVTSGWC